MQSPKLFLFPYLIIFLISCLINPLSLQRDCYTENRDLIDNQFGEQDLLISDVYIPYLGAGNMLVTTQNMVIVILKSSYFTNGIFGYDINTGELAWNKNSVSPSFLYASDDVLYEGAYDSILILDPLSGKTLRNINLTGVGNITSFKYQDNTFFVAGSSGRFSIYNLGNDTLKISEPDFTKHILIEENNTRYFLLNGKLHAEDVTSNKIIWEANIGDSVLNSIFMDKMIFVRTGRSIFSGDIYAIDKLTGNFLWKRNGDVISNIDVTDAGVYFLSVDGYFLGLNLQDGSEILKLEFSSKPFELRYIDQESIGGYFVDVNQETNRVALSLGDSCQLMVISLE